MLPDLRIVIAAVISTFVLTVGVGFYASSRLINEPLKSTDSLAALDATPVNRIALSWPAPTRQPEPLALDFAVTAKALRNPVRDVTGELPAAGQPSQPAPAPVRTTAVDLSRPPAETSAVTPTATAPAVAAPKAASPETASPEAAAPSAALPVSPQIGAPPAAPPPAAPQSVVPVAVPPAPSEPAAVMTEAPKPAPKPAPEPDIRVAVKYPPITEFPPELRAPVAPPTPAVAAVAPPSEAPATTGSIAERPGSVKTDDDANAQPGEQPETKLASRPEPDDTTGSAGRAIETIPLPKPAPDLKPAKAAPKKAAPKKAAAKRAARRPVRRAAQPAQPAVPNFFNMFTLQQPR